MHWKTEAQFLEYWRRRPGLVLDQPRPPNLRQNAQPATGEFIFEALLIERFPLFRGRELVPERA